jgi:hypothetical protein
MCVVATITLLAIPSLEKVANLCLVNARCDTEINFAVSVKAVLVVATSSQIGSAKLCLLQVGSMAQLGFRVRVSAIRRGALATLEKATHFRFGQLRSYCVVGLSSLAVLLLGCRTR